MKESAIAIIFPPSRKQVLLVKRCDVPVWVLPGGGIEADEPPSLAAKREAFEETGVTVEILRAVAEYSPINRLASQTYTFECLANEDGALATGPESKEVAYFPLNNLPESFFFLHREWLNDALANHTDVIHKPLSQITYANLAIYVLKHPIHVFRMLLSRLGFPLNS